MALTSGSPGSGLLEVGIALVLKDRFSQQAREASTHIKKLHMDAKNAVNANLSAIADMSRVGMAISIGAGVAMGAAINTGAEFIDTMVSVRAITDATTEQLSQMGRVAKDLGFRTMFNAQDVASGMKYLAMAGTDAKDISEVIEGAAMAANAVGMELGGKGGAADMITNVMRMFRIEAAEASSVIGDQLVKATLSSNMSMDDLAQSIRYAGADMVNLKQNLPAVSAMIGTMANAGIQGSMAGTAIANMARYLNKSISDPKYKGGKMLETLGLGKEDFVDAEGDIVDFGIVLEKIRDKMIGVGMDSTEQAGALLSIFGVRGTRAASVITRDLEGYRALLEKINNESAGFATEVVEERMASISGKLNQLRESLTNLKISFTESVEPVIKPFVVAFTFVFNSIKALLEIPFLGTVISGSLAATTVILGVGSAIMFLRSKWLLFTNDSQITTGSWMSILKGGWKSATISASQYLNMQTAIIAQQKAGIGGNVGLAMMGGGIPMGVKQTISKKGVPMYFQKNAAGGTVRMSQQQVLNKTQNMSPENLTKATMGTSYIGFGRGAAKTAASTGTKIAARGILGGIGKSLTGLLGMFGGPWGIAVMAGMIFIPKLINGIKSSSNAAEKQTDSTNRLKTALDFDIAQRLGDREKEKQTESQEKLTEELKILATIIGEWAEKLHGSSQKDGTITINLRGDIEKTVKAEIANSQSESNYDTNTP